MNNNCRYNIITVLKMWYYFIWKKIYVKIANIYLQRNNIQIILPSSTIVRTKLIIIEIVRNTANNIVINIIASKMVINNEQDKTKLKVWET